MRHPENDDRVIGTEPNEFGCSMTLMAVEDYSLYRPTVRARVWSAWIANRSLSSLWTAALIIWLAIA